jgi:hypothetical protein
MELMKEMWDNGWTGRLMLAFITLVALLIPAVIYWSVKEQARWDAFATAHACKVVGVMSGSAQTGVGFGMTANGQIGTLVTTTSTPGKTGWLCDDGITYWR